MCAECTTPMAVSDCECVVQCIEKLMKYLQYRLLVSELVWYLVTEVVEVEKLTQSINYVLKAYRSYIFVKLSRNTLATWTTVDKINCVISFITLV